MHKVIFACIHNAGRSQMAAAFFNAISDPTKAVAVSAGTEPASRVHPEVVTAMRERGHDLGSATPQLLSQDLAAGATLLVTMGCGEPSAQRVGGGAPTQDRMSCPVIPGARHEDWPLEDPKGQPLESVRRIREEIRERVERLIEENDWS